MWKRRLEPVLVRVQGGEEEGCIRQLLEDGVGTESERSVCPRNLFHAAQAHVRRMICTEKPCNTQQTLVLSCSQQDVSLQP